MDQRGVGGMLGLLLGIVVTTAYGRVSASAATRMCHRPSELAEQIVRTLVPSRAAGMRPAPCEKHPTRPLGYLCLSGLPAEGASMDPTYRPGFVPVDLHTAPGSA
jgi:hypothetical protein